MSIENYSELQAAVRNWLNRTKTTDTIYDRVPEFIALAEANFNRELRVRRMLQRSYADIDAESYALPSDWLAMRNIDITNSGIVYPLDYLSPELMDRYHDNQTGQPRYYTVLGDEFQFHPVPDAAYRINISYFKKIPSLSDSATTNWLLTNHPDLYLFGATAEAHKYVKNMEEYGLDVGRVEGALKEIRKADGRDKYSGSTLRMRTA